ncbi:uncharacterized protein LOC107264364 [Cephus cinctus]|uniref:Uncharacterized protein LOC107264364 n=1 Tax=Cephus cinctus TaxID=211228 RepID=A0AAJ7FEN3_CEPCN|nr:uncharacterized protein LOC107264364 [Cephus cinctus]
MEGTGTKHAKLVCPSAEELSVIVKNVQCVQCGLVFQSEPRLRLHDLKVHQHKKLDKTIKENVQYHCPVITCIYALKSQRHFTTMKYLKQHYLKVHAAKTFTCTRCNKGFSTEAAKEAHVRVCGTQFTCACLKIFNTYEALLTHARRFFHTVDEKYKNSSRKTNSKAPLAARMPFISLMRTDKPITILPNSGGYGAIDRITGVGENLKVAHDIAVQTDEIKRGKRMPTPVKCNSVKERRVSRQTQTSVTTREKRHRRSAETQTGEDCNSKKMADVSKVRKRKKAGLPKKAESAMVKEDLSFPENFVSENFFPNSPLPLRHDVGLPDFWEDKNTSGTQTSPEKDLLEVLNDSVTQTDLDAFYNPQEPTSMHCGSQTTSLNALSYVEDASVANSFSFTSTSGISRSDPMLMDETYRDRFSSIETQTEQAHLQAFFDSDTLSRSFALSSNIETQTTENFENMEQLLYSNTCTQTCDEILPSDLGLSNIQTQTAWPRLDDATVSTETQTKLSTCHEDSNISLAARSWLHTQTSHTETQTDLLSIFDELE